MNTHFPLTPLAAGLAALLFSSAAAHPTTYAATNAPPTVAIPGFEGVRMAVYPVTNGDYARFCNDAGHKPPAYWKDGSPPAGREKHPVVEVSLSDAEAYAAWLMARTPGVRFRIPTEEEWVAAAQGSVPVVFNGPLVARLLAEGAGREVEFVHPKSARRGEKVRLADVLSLSERGGVRGWADHARHCGFIDTDLFRTLSADGGATATVDAPDASRSAIGCRDMAGNTWDWTATVREAQNGAERGRLVNVIKGGSWYANRPSCLPGFEGEGRAASGRYNTVGFRLVAETSPATTPTKEPPAMTAAIFRIAEIEVKPEFLDAYLSAARDIGATSVREEPGVLCIFPMQDAEKPTSIRILEIYASDAAYKAHLATPHFRAYKEGTPHMIEFLRLAPMRPLDPALFPDIFRKTATTKEQP